MSVHNILVKINRQIIDVLSKNISTTCVSYCKQLRYANQCWQKNHVTNNCQSPARPRTLRSATKFSSSKSEFIQ